MKFIQIISLILLSLTFAASSEFHYGHNGKDWSNNEWQCLSGTSQSPISISNSSIHLNEKYQLTLKKAAEAGNINIVNNGHSIQANYPWIEFQATNAEEQVKSYKAVQLHFHSPTEHSFDGNLLGLEIHIVCDQIDGPDNGLTKGVLALIFEVNDSYQDNPLVEPFAQAAASYASSAARDDVHINPNFYKNLQNSVKAFGTKLRYYSYQGSLTTPPCSEIVEWYIIKQSFPISKKQLSHFQALWSENQEFAEGKGNNRVVQDLNGRTIIQGQVKNQLKITRQAKNLKIFGQALQYAFLAVLLIFILVAF